ncbi:MAG TPA: matrixin family metalloprotease, partial [Tepidisphaeraceae bacterium]|nr:matrixin family metalloprotease [Tepidisphaeraceae bacterium]
AVECLERRSMLSSGLIEFDPTDHDGVPTHVHTDAETASLDHVHATDEGHDEEESVQGGWGDSTVTYGYSNLFAALDSNMTNGEIRQAIEESLLVWTGVTPLRFFETADPGGVVNDDTNNINSPEIRIGAHYIDGSSGTNVLAHAYGPGSGRGGDMHFDTGNTYNLSGAGYFIQTAAHEIGHAIGLPHANGNVVNDVCPPATPAIMDACISGVYDTFGDSFLYSNDINAIQNIYGDGLGYLLELDGTLHVTGTQANDTFYVSTSGNNLTIESAAYGSFTRSMNGISEIDLHTRGGNDTVWVYSLGDVGLYIDGADGNDVFQIGNGDYDTNILSNITLNGGNGNDEVVVNDITDGIGSDSYTFNYGFQFFKPSNVTTFFSGDVDKFSLVASPNNDTINVIQVPTGTSFNLNGWSGNDRFNMGVTVYDFAVNSPVTVTGFSGTDSIYIDDTESTGNDTHTITESTYLKTGETSPLTYQTIESFNLEASDGEYDNVMALNGGSDGTTYNLGAGPGDDTFNFGNNDVDTNMENTIWNLDGATGTDALNYRDTNDAGDTDVYTIDFGEIVKVGGGVTTTVNYTSIGALDFFGSAGATDIDVNGLSQLTTIRGGAGDDNIVLEDSFNVTFPFPLVYSTVVDTGLGRDAVRINPDGSSDTVSAVFETTQDIGVLVVGANGILQTSAGGNVVVDVQGLTLNGRINLADNAFIRRDWGAAAQTYYTQRLTAGYNGGAWNGAQASFYSSVADDDSNHGLGISNALEAGLNNVSGVALATTDLVIRYTLYGDTNLNQTVNFTDLLRMSQNYNLAGGWSKGDFNYDGTVNFEDLLKVAQNYGQSAMSLATTKARGARSSILNSREDDVLFGLV